jgi:hypothetical protein
MDWFDDIQVEELNDFDFKESYQDELFEEDTNEDKTFNTFLNSKYDF